MNMNKNSGYGLISMTSAPFTTGKVFMLAATTDANYGNISDLWTPDNDGVVRLYSTWATAIAACVAGRGDIILVSPSYTTAPTLAQLATMHTNKIYAQPAHGRNADGSYTTLRAISTLPASTATPYFTVTGKVKILNIIGEVTTAFQAQANAVKLIANPTVGADVDMCATVEGNAAAVGSLFTITGTFANAMIKTVSAAVPSQASPIIVTAGTIDFSAAATSTGATKWLVNWLPLDPGALILPA